MMDGTVTVELLPARSCLFHDDSIIWPFLVSVADANEGPMRGVLAPDAVDVEE